MVFIHQHTNHSCRQRDLAVTCIMSSFSYHFDVVDFGKTTNVEIDHDNGGGIWNEEQSFAQSINQKLPTLFGNSPNDMDWFKAILTDRLKLGRVWDLWLDPASNQNFDVFPNSRFNVSFVLKVLNVHSWLTALLRSDDPSGFKKLCGLSTQISTVWTPIQCKLKVWHYFHSVRLVRAYSTLPRWLNFCSSSRVELLSPYLPVTFRVQRPVRGVARDYFKKENS